ncbi:hypothetical protein RMCBS344292_06527 [Rhizopus microsporus]|nr:hypothetical protein RMCBS344292_06527 [Rhizopus microsporus]
MKSQNSLMINSNLGVNDTSNSSAGDLDNDSDFFRLFDLDDVDNRGMSGQPENKSDHVDQPTVEQNQLQEQKSSIELDSQYHNHPLEAVIILDDNKNNAKNSRQEVAPSDTNEFIESMKTLEIDNDETHYRPGITLRKRKDIQLHPFTIEKNKFKSLLKGSSITKVVSSVEPTITEDQSDTEFVPDAREEEDPSLPIDCTQSALNDDSQPKEVMRIDSHNPRSVSPEAQTKEKKIVTYSKKRRTKATSSSHREKLKEKIFEAKRLEEELGPFVDILEHKPMSHNQQNNPSQSTLSSSLDFLKDHDNNDAELMLVDDNEDEQPVFLHRRRLRRRIESDEDDDDDEEEQLQTDNHDSIFDFPESVESLTGGYTSRKIIPVEKNENDVVPVVDDEFEYRPAKRRRVKVADLRKNKNILKGVLPASFLKVYERELNEEEKRSTSRTARHSALRKRKSDNNKNISTLDQPFDAFLGSQSEFNEDRSSEQYDSYRYASSTRLVHEKMHSKSQSSRSIHRTRIDEYFNHDTEAIEDNRIPNRQSTVQVRKTSQVSTQRPASKAKKKRKRPRRAMDDIYIHPQPKARTHLSQHRSFQQTLDDMSISSKRAYNDGHFTVQRPSVEWVRNVAEYLRSTKNAASLRPIPKYTLSLAEVVEKIQRVFDPDLRCSVRLKNTVYLHHRLLQPLLSTRPNSKRAYAHLKSSFENPVIFHRRDLDNDSDFFRLFDLDDVDNRGMSGQPENKSDHVDQPTVEQNQLQEQKPSIELNSQFHNHPLEAVIILEDNKSNAKNSRQEVAPSDTNEFIESMKTLEIDNDETHYRPGITLRKRKDIQLHPFTIEKNKFKSLLKGSSITRVVSSVEPTITEDQSDTEFVPDAREEEDPSLPIDCTQSALDDDSQPKEVMRIDSHNPRSVSPEAQKREKRIITYSKKRRTKATSSSHREKLKEKIFEAKRLEEELGPFIDILEHKPMSHNQQNNTSQSTLSSSLDFLKDHNSNDAELVLVDDNEDEQPVFLHRRRLRRRIESDDDDDDDEEEQLQQDDHDSIFDFPENVESLTGGYTSRKIIPAEKNENDVVPVVDDEFEYRPAKRRRVKVADLRKNKNILKGVLPASFLKVYERELNEE